ncbi:Uncharacterised protein [BD1-7 clade bacterium]|uniref:Uncharacterized protein n=1 Tax=BD1-7 clade bacterium TaxID=2029982 RepID=A0A5S9PQZ0_9GAMM|nr:Uncharacterised protein [BD1-7 clade bacterium]
MARSLAARVNEKLYHAGLLLALTGSEDAAAKARHQAQQFAAGAMLEAAYRLFILEVAESCQIRQVVMNAGELKAMLAQESRSHAVVETLLSLEADDNSWLSSLHREYEVFVAGEQGSASVAASIDNNTQLISLDVTQHFDAQTVLDDFKAFVGAQREFLQEW